MRHAILTLTAIIAVLTIHAERDIRFYMNTGEVKSIAVSCIDSITFDTENDLLLLVLQARTESLPIAELDSIQYATLPTDVYVTYDQEQATVLNPYAFDGVEVGIDGAKVTVTSAMTTEIAYHLTGVSDAGTFKLYGEKKYELHLDNLTLSNNQGAAINIQCKKRGQIYLTEGSNNLLTDNPTYTSVAGEDQKGTIFSEGQLVFLGEGTLGVTGNYKHAICSDDYIAVRSGNINVSSATGDALHANDSIVIYGGNLTLTANDDVIDCEGPIAIYDGHVEIQSETDAAKGIKSDTNILIAGGKTDITMRGNAAYDDSGDLSYATAIKSNGHYRQHGGTLTLNAYGTGGQGISADSTLNITEGYATITIAGTGSSYTTTSGTTDYYSVKALKSDGAMNLLGGTIDCKSTGNGGKCIVSDGLLTIGTTDGNAAYPIITATTSGSALSAGSTSQGNNNRPGGGGWPGGGGGWPGGMGGESGFNAAPKAIKGDADVVINSGTIYIKTQADGGEGLESKARMTINGGTIECATYDDGINAATSLTINGGAIYSHATNNDGIDSNGTLAIYGGVVLSSGTSAPEEGFDCDNNTFILAGGTLIGTGGATSSPTSASQYYGKLSSVSVSSGKYLAIKNSNGDVICSYRCPNTVSGATILVSAPELTQSNHTLMYNVTSVSSPSATLFDGTFTTGGTLSGGSSKTFTPSKK